MSRFPHGGEVLGAAPGHPLLVPALSAARDLSMSPQQALLDWEAIKRIPGLAGYWPASIEYLWADDAGTTLPSIGGGIGKRLDAFGTNHAVQATASYKPILRQIANSKRYWLDSNTPGSALTATLGSLGAACTVAKSGLTSVDFSENVRIASTYNLMVPFAYNADIAIFNRTLTASEKALVTRYMMRASPSVTNMLSLYNAGDFDNIWTTESIMDASSATAADFVTGIVTTKASGQITNRIPDALLTTSTNTPVIITQSDGTPGWSPHNYYLNSAAPVTQTNTVVVGQDYTVSVTGTGSLALSNGGSGTATEGSPRTFTATTATLVSTKTGTLETIQLNKGPVPTAYLATTSSAKYGAPISRAPNGEMMLRIEPPRTNYLVQAQVPATQTVSLNAATYTLSVEGSGSCELSGGPTGTATAAAPVTFVLGSTTAVTFTVSGTVTQFQCENGPTVTSHINTFAAAVGRSLPNVSLALSSVPALGAEYLAYVQGYIGASPAGFIYPLATDKATGLADYLRCGVSTARAVTFSYYTATVAQHNLIQTRALGTNALYDLTVRVKENGLLMSIDGTPFGSTGTDEAATTWAPTSVVLGNWYSSIGDTTWIRRFALADSTPILTSDVQGYFHRYEPSADSYDIFLLAGQSNVYGGAPVDAVIDVSGGVVWQINQIGTLLEAVEPLAHPVPISAIGWGLAFARDFYNPATGRNVLLLPCGVGNTGFADTRWNPGNDLCNMAHGLVSYARNQYPGATLKGILWLQGEREADWATPWTENQYAAALDALIAHFRASYGADLPFIVGGLRPGYVADNVNRLGVATALANTPTRVAHTAYANPNTTPVIGGGDNNAHYTAAEDRLLAGRYFTAWSSLT